MAGGPGDGIRFGHWHSPTFPLYLALYCAGSALMRVAVGGSWQSSGVVAGSLFAVVLKLWLFFHRQPRGGGQSDG